MILLAFFPINDSPFVPSPQDLAFPPIRASLGSARHLVGGLYLNPFSLPVDRHQMTASSWNPFYSCTPLPFKILARLPPPTTIRDRYKVKAFHLSLEFLTFPHPLGLHSRPSPLMRKNLRGTGNRTELLPPNVFVSTGSPPKLDFQHPCSFLGVFFFQTPCIVQSGSFRVFSAPLHGSPPSGCLLL